MQSLIAAIESMGMAKTSFLPLCRYRISLNEEATTSDEELEGLFGMHA